MARLTRGSLKVLTILLLTISLSQLGNQPYSSHEQSSQVPVVFVWSNVCSSSNITVTCGSFSVGSTMSVQVNVTNAPAFNAFEFFLFYDPWYITATSIDLDTGTVFSSGNPSNLEPNPFAPAGTVRLSVTNNAQPSSYTGANGTLANISFRILRVGASPIALSAGIPSSGGAGTQLINGNPPPLPATLIQVGTSDGYFTNQPAGDPAVVYDSDGNNSFDTGEPVISGATPTIGTALNDDAGIKYLDSNSNNAWNATELVFYDSNNNNLYDSEFGEKLIAGTPPGSGSGKDDPLVKFVDANANSIYDSAKVGPIARFTYNPPAPKQGDTVTFDATSSTDVDGGLLTRFRWDVGTLSTSIGQSATYSIPLSAGSYSIRLTVWDLDDNFTAIQVQRVDVASPDVHDLQISGFTVTPIEVQAGQNISLTITVFNSGFFNETYDLAVSYTPPLTVIRNAISQNLTVGVSTTFRVTLPTLGLSVGFYTITSTVTIADDDIPSNNSVSKTFRVLGEEPPPSLTPILLAVGVVAVIASLAAVIQLLRRRRRRDAE